jgi:glycosyltransferase involved in cell wall biosynthesis
MKFLINASNLHTGGGVQVATSVISELSSFVEAAPNIHVSASSVVDRNLRSINAQLERFGGYRVQDTFGLAALWQNSPNYLDNYDVVFTIFGPLYSWRRPHRSVVGFAQPWIIYPDNEIARQLPWIKRIQQRLKYWVQSQFFSRADLMIVELDHVREGLVRQGVAPSRNIRVIHNTLSALYSAPSMWRPVNIPSVTADIRLGFIGRDYAHKNTAIFPAVREHLRKQHGIEASFYVTFTPDEWAACSSSFRDCCVNVGALDVSQCPSFYQAMDGVIFPSLLECFSATPLEAMAMERPLFASDRPFIRDVCGAHAHYFDPMDAASAATCIAAYFKSGEPRRSALAAAREHALNFSNPTNRAREYLACLYEAAGLEPPIRNT